MKHTYYTVRISSPTADRNWQIGGNYHTKREALKDADIFKAAGFWISVREHTSETSTTEKLITSTWNTYGN